MNTEIQDDIPVLYDILHLGSKAASALHSKPTLTQALEQTAVDEQASSGNEESPEAIEFAAKMAATTLGADPVQSRSDISPQFSPQFTPQQRKEFELEVRLAVMNELQAELGLSLQTHLEQMMDESIQEVIAQTVEQITAQLESEMRIRLRDSLQPGLQACLYAAIDQAVLKNSDHLRDASSN
jgi:hypothetical protein